MDLFYKLGQLAATRLLNIFNQDTADQKGTPFPEKSQTILAELFAKRLQEEDDSPYLIHPENGKRDDRLNRPATWGHASYIDENQPSMGLVTPSNPRG